MRQTSRYGGFSRESSRLYDYQYVTEQKPAILRRFRELLGS